MVEYVISEYTRIFVDELDKGVRCIISARASAFDVKIYVVREGKFCSIAVHVIRDLIYANHPGHTALVRTYIEHHYWGNPAEYRFNKLMSFISLLMRDKEEQLHHNKIIQHFL